MKEYEKYVEYCKRKNIAPKSWYEWKYCTYTSIEEELRIR